MINFCYDRLAMPNIGYPNLARWQAEPFTAEWRQFDAHWPRTVPLRLTMYLDSAQIPYGTYTVADAPVGSWYPIALSWFDFTCDYFELLSSEVAMRIIKKEIKLLFYYHEGDNPARIYSQLGRLLPSYCYHFISANTAADDLPSATYFSEHEFFFRHVNRDQWYMNLHGRKYEFTALNRVHKWWRAAVMSDLRVHGILENSLWSYNCVSLKDDDYEANPIEVDVYDELWRDRMHEFVLDSPFHCDEFSKQQQNDHHVVNAELYTQSYFQIVIETHFDADQSGGAFITEKTWKPIKYGQPFVVIGPPGTLQALRDAGYRVFDSVLDNSYDTITDNTQRYLAVRKLLESIQQQGAADVYAKCVDDVHWNQRNFNTLRAVTPLNSLLEKLKCQI
jgi:hypothetical protein